MGQHAVQHKFSWIRPQVCDNGRATQMGYLDGQDCDKSENRVCLNGFKILNIEKIIFATAKIIFSM